MEAVYYAARGNLRRLLKEQPTWTHKQYAQAVGMSVGWVKKWIKRLCQAPPEDEAVLHSQSRARQHPPERISQAVVDRLVEMRDQPPEGLGRTPGPKALLYYLPRDADLLASGERLPRSSRTVYRILRQAGRIAQRRPRVHDPIERPAPMSQWQLDFKDASTVAASADGKQQHVVEVLNTVDMGTSVLVAAQVRADFTAQTTLEMVADLVRTHGRPRQLTFDRDTRFVSSPHGSDFPSALVRFCHCLGIAVRVCDPHHPEQNGFVERYHRSYQAECLAVYRPGTLDQVREVTEQFQQHYHYERPHQGLSCGNLPPRTAFPTLPELPAVPDLVNPDRWLEVSDGLHLVRTVSRNGTVSIDLKDYYVGRALAGQRVALHLSAKARAWLVIQGTQLLKSLPLKGLYGAALSFEHFVQLMSQQARAEQRLRTAQERRVRHGRFSSP
jgi:transposase InsO family protein